MSRDVRVVCRPTSAAGFRLAGLAVTTASDRAAAATALDDLTDAALVLVEDTLHDPTRKATGPPVVLPFPGPAWEAVADDRVVEILRRAIGYRVRLT